MTQTVIFFDGVCNLCQGSVQFVIQHDPKRYFRYASLQGQAGTEILKQQGLSVEEYDSFLLWENGKIYTRSTAALRVCRKLSGLWPILYLFILVPTFIRDAVYNWVARNRYRWFGKQETCWVPTPELRSLFID